MKEITISYAGEYMTAILIRPENPRLAICQDRVVLLNQYDQIEDSKDLLVMFPQTLQAY